MIFKRAEFKNKNAYKKFVDQSRVFKNTVDNAVPQTAVAEAVRKHMESGDNKKVAIIGFDGARADSLPLLVKSEYDQYISESKYSGLETLKAKGGIFVAFTGGESGNEQNTSTPQGWASMLTGKWGRDTGVVGFTDKLTKANTVLYEYAEKGRKTVFNAIWPEHFETTYKNEIEKVEANGVPLKYYQCEDNDDILTEKMIKSVTEDNCDISFCILEQPDHIGHETGFGNKNPNYVKAVTLCDKNAYAIIKAIESRPSYDEEDWLIIISSDHGGHLRGHGSQFITDRTIFIATNKPKYFG